VSGQADHSSLAARLWASRWPEAAWAVFAIANLAWMVLAPGWAMLPFHFTWISLLLLYGLGYRANSRALTWWLLVPVMAGAALLFIDARIRATAPYDELVELPVMVVLVFAISRLTRRRQAAMAALDKLSRHNGDLLERQRAFVQNASHELRTPITVALAHAELLLKPSSDAEAAQDAAIVADELARLRRLADRLLLLATAEQPGHHQPVPVHLAAVLDDTLHRWERVPRRWLTGHRNDATVLADPDRLVVALDAILDNAVRFTHDGDPIELSVQRSGPDAAITIADSGPGIPDGQLDTVFDRFSTPDPHRDTAHNFGLGLSIVRAIADAHDGRVTAAPGRLGGAAVTLWLPLHEQASSPIPAADPQTAQTATGPA
jgi:two-component system, OmpR family, sensor kinase